MYLCGGGACCCQQGGRVCRAVLPTALPSPGECLNGSSRSRKTHPHPPNPAGRAGHGAGAQPCGAAGGPVGAPLLHLLAPPGQRARPGGPGRAPAGPTRHLQRACGLSRRGPRGPGGGEEKGRGANWRWLVGRRTWAAPGSGPPPAPAWASQTAWLHGRRPAICGCACGMAGAGGPAWAGLQAPVLCSLVAYRSTPY